MRKYLLKIILFLSICFVILTFIMLQFGGNIDYFYVKFTTPKAKSLIIGDSRSMQGIQPKIMNSKLANSKYELPIFNYSFTVAQASISPLYNNSIEKKLDDSSKNGLFIISITPWMLASDKKNNNALGEYRESDSPPHNMNYVNVNPNYEYLFKNLNYFHFKSLFRRSSTMHKDGWLEENNLPKSPEVFIEWKNNQSIIFDKMISDYTVSKIRLENLVFLIKKLKKHGEIYLVRMPIDQDFIEKEKYFYTDFDSDMRLIADSNNIPYINFNQETSNSLNYKTYDGHHLDKKGGSVFTKALCDSIIEYKQRIITQTK